MKVVLKEMWVKVFFYSTVFCFIGGLAKSGVLLSLVAAPFAGSPKKAVTPPPAPAVKAPAAPKAAAVNKPNINQQQLNQLQNNLFNNKTKTALNKIDLPPVPAVAPTAVSKLKPLKPMPKLVGAGVTNILTKKNPGYWLVDPRGGNPKADSASLEEVFFNVSDDDIVKVAGGEVMMDFPLLDFKRNITLISEDTNMRVLVNFSKKGWGIIRRTKMKFKDLDIKVNGQPLIVVNSELEFENVDFKGHYGAFGSISITESSKISLVNVNAAGLGGGTFARVKNSELIIVGSSIKKFRTGVSLGGEFKLKTEKVYFERNDTGISAHSGMGKIDIIETRFHQNFRSGVYVTTSGIDLNITGSSFMGNDNGLYLRSASAVVEESDFVRNKRNGIYLNESKLKMYSGQIRYNRFGIYKEPGSSVTVGDIKFFGNKKGSYNDIGRKTASY